MAQWLLRADELKCDQHGLNALIGASLVPKARGQVVNRKSDGLRIMQFDNHIYNRILHLDSDTPQIGHYKGNLESAKGIDQHCDGACRAELVEVLA